MTRSSHVKLTRLHQLTLTGMMLGISLGMVPTVLAHNGASPMASSPRLSGHLIAQSSRSRYTPPPPSGNTSGSTTGGVRGQCSGRSDLSLLALAPNSHVGLTRLTRPTFAWFVPETDAYDLVFQLFQEGVEEPLYDVTMPSQAGMMTWSLPDSEAALKVGETYRWRVIMICNRNRPSSSIRDEARVRVVAPPHGVISAPSADADYVNQMAAASFWYDALAATIRGDNAHQLRWLRSGLLADLAQIEAATHPQRAEKLQRILEIEQ